LNYGEFIIAVLPKLAKCISQAENAALQFLSTGKLWAIEKEKKQNAQLEAHS